MSSHLTVAQVVDWLRRSATGREYVRARTPHGTYRFAVTAVERGEIDQPTLVLEEVARFGSIRAPETTIEPVPVRAARDGQDGLLIWVGPHRDGDDGSPLPPTIAFTQEQAERIVMAYLRGPVGPVGPLSAEPHQITLNVTGDGSKLLEALTQARDLLTQR